MPVNDRRAAAAASRSARSTSTWSTMAHSIPESQALIIRTPAGTVLHTGDWKIDRTPVIGTGTDEAKLKALGEEGCLALVGNSTNAVRDGVSPSEADVATNIAALIKSRQGPRRGDDLRLQRRAPARRRAGGAGSRPRSHRRRPRHGARRADLARDSACSKASSNSARSMPTAICRTTRWCACAPAARASRARRWPASPRTSIRTSRWRAATW